MSAHVNSVAARNGKAAAVCSCCNRKSRPVYVCREGEPDLFRLSVGWSQAPFNVDFVHSDGSRGSMFTCPECNKKLHRGEVLKMRGGVAA